MTEYVIHIKDAKTLYEYTDFSFPLDAYLREEIVRCRDCKHAEKVCWCSYFGQFGDLPAVRPNDFCSRGERRQDD